MQGTISQTYPPLRDCQGLLLAEGQVCRERGRHGKVRIVRLDAPFVFVRREGEYAYDDAPTFPTDLTVTTTHEIQVTVQVRAGLEETAVSQVQRWVDESKDQLPPETVSFKVGAK